MLKRRRGLLSGGLTSSCRIKAEALARAFNSRIWPCTWVYRRSATDSDDADQDEEYFEASPSPSEDEDLSGLDRDCSAATEEGRAKLYELLHHHAVDDATDVFYDVSEHAGLSETVDRDVMQNLGILTDSMKLEIKCGETSSNIDDKEMPIKVACATECSEKKNCDSINCDCDGASNNINNVEESVNLTLYSKCLNYDVCTDLSNNCESGGTPKIIGELSNNIGEISNNIREISSNTGEISSNIGETSTNIGDISNNIGEAFNNIGEISNNIDEISSNRGETSNNIGEISSNIGEISNNIGDTSNNIGEISNNINNVYECVNLTNSSESPNGNICKDLLITCDANGIPNSINASNKSSNLICLSKCLNNDVCKDFLNGSESAETSKSINDGDETMNLTCSFECLKNDIFKDLSNNCDSDETSKSVNSVYESVNLTRSYECLNNDICKDLSINCDLAKSLNTDDEYVNSTYLTNCFSNDNGTDLPETSNSQTMIINDSSDGGSGTVTDFKGIETLPFEMEEVLTVEIDSNSFKIHQTENPNFHEVVLSNDEHIVNENSTSEFLIRDSEDKTSHFSESRDSVLIEVTNEVNSPCENGCTENSTLSPLGSPNSPDNCRLKVFTELRPMISRSTSLKTGKTPPGTPSRKKMVRFADVLGLDLEDVRHIISGDLPNIPSSAYRDLVLGDDAFPPAVPQSFTIHLNNRQKASWESGPGAPGPNAMYPLFAIPGQQPDFMDRVRSRGICLDSVVIADCNIQCTCRVMNWSFNKKVLARYTTDKWFSSNDINASYVCDSTRDGTDGFAFSIFLTPQRNDVEFALRYEVNGKEYWDNNDGQNYSFSYSSISNMSQSSVPSSPTWVHQFW